LINDTDHLIIILKCTSLTLVCGWPPWSDYWISTPAIPLTRYSGYKKPACEAGGRV